MTSGRDRDVAPDAASRLSWVAPLFLAVAILQLVPIWSAPHVPTSDGPSHLYNATILRDLATGHGGIFTRYYRIDWRPHPNWLGHVILAFLLLVVPPVIAEKLLVSAIVLLFLGGAWMLARAVDARGEVYAFLALPFTYHLLLQLGFYNFSLSAGQYLIIVALWWRRRQRADPGTVALIAVLLVVCYFSHPMSAFLAIASIGVLWLWSLTKLQLRRHAIHLVALAPALVLLSWFVSKQVPTLTVGGNASARDLYEFLAHIGILFTFDERQVELGNWLFGLFVLLAIATPIVEYALRHGPRRRRDADVFLLIAIAFAALYALSPESFAGGAFLRERMALFLYLAPLPWFSPYLPKWCMASLAIVLSIVAVINVGFLTTRFRANDLAVEDFLHETRAIAPESTVLPLIRSRNPAGAIIPVLSHAIDYSAIEKRLIDLDNYEPGTGYFPIIHQPGVADADVNAIESDPEDIDIEKYVESAQYIVTWEIPPRSPLFARIDEHYRLVSKTERARVYRNFSLVAPLASREIVLLPLSGTAAPVGGPVGSWFRVDQHIRNTGSAVAHLALSTCEFSACELDLAPGQTVPIAGRRPYTLVYASPADVRHLSFETVVRRIDEHNVWKPVVVPAVPQRAFQRTAIEIEDVPWSEHLRLNLRMWLFGVAKAQKVVVSLRSGNDQLLARKTLDVGDGGYFTDGDFRWNVAGVRPGMRVKVRIECADTSVDATIWAFITSSQYEGTIVTLHLPKSGVGKGTL
jgi:hypothetical protein